MINDGGHALLGEYDETDTSVPSAATDGDALKNNTNRIAVLVDLGTRDTWTAGIVGYSAQLAAWIYLEPIATEAVAVTVSSKVIQVEISANCAIPFELGDHIQRIAVYHIGTSGTATTKASCVVVGA